jgi:hypothetical protein
MVVEKELELPPALLQKRSDDKVVSSAEAAAAAVVHSFSPSTVPSTICSCSTSTSLVVVVVVVVVVVPKSTKRSWSGTVAANTHRVRPS